MIDCDIYVAEDSSKIYSKFIILQLNLFGYRMTACIFYVVEDSTKKRKIFHNFTVRYI